MARVLVVDDDEPFRSMLRLKLENMGHQVFSAENGLDVVDLARNNRVDLVITDIIMPEKDGLEVLLDLKKHTPNLRVIATSGGGRLVSVDCLESAKRLGAIRVLVKPFTDEEFRDAVGFALESRERIV